MKKDILNQVEDSSLSALRHDLKAYLKQMQKTRDPEKAAALSFFAEQAVMAAKSVYTPKAEEKRQFNTVTLKKLKRETKRPLDALLKSAFQGELIADVDVQGLKNIEFDNRLSWIMMELLKNVTRHHCALKKEGLPRATLSIVQRNGGLVLSCASKPHTLTKFADLYRTLKELELNVKSRGARDENVKGIKLIVRILEMFKSGGGPCCQWTFVPMEDSLASKPGNVWRNGALDSAGEGESVGKGKAKRRQSGGESLNRLERRSIEINGLGVSLHMPHWCVRRFLDESFGFDREEQIGKIIFEAWVPL
jgi:hypothetical protein